MKKKELLFSVTKEDFKVEYTKGSGKGGQNRNKRETAVRITHKETGLTSYCCDERSQLQNKNKAFMRLVKSAEFQKWLKRKTSAIMFNVPTKEELQKRVEQMVEVDLKNGNIKIEEI